jgi:hypothetical protein
MMSFEGKYLIYGHIHNNKPPTVWPWLKTMGNALDSQAKRRKIGAASFSEYLHAHKK